MKTWGKMWDLLALRLAQLMGISGGAHVLDVGTGGGSALLAALKCVGPTGYVYSLDRKEEWVKKTQKELDRLKIPNAEVVQSDDRSIDKPDGIFDYAISGFIDWEHSLDIQEREFHSPDLVMREIFRTLKPGGKLGISTWILQSDTEWMEEFIESFAHPARCVYSKESEEAWEILMRESPFDDYMLLPEIIDYTYSSLNEWWTEMMGYGWKSQIESLVNSKEISIEEIQKAAFDKVEEFTSKDGVTFSRKVLFILAEKSR